MVTLTDFSDNIYPNADGLWVSRTSRPVSFPAEGNSNSLKLEENSFWFKHRNNCLVEVLKLYPPSGPLFDLGGGNGFVSLALKQNGFESVVVEPGPEGARNSYNRGLSPVLCATIEDAYFKSHSLPAVGVFDVVEHFENDEALLKTIHANLKADGRLYVTVPAFQLLWSGEDHYAGHFRRYTRNSIAKVLNNAGFEIEFSTYFFRFLVLPIFFLRALPHKLGFERKRTLEVNQRDHKPPSGFVHMLMRKMFMSEINSIRNRKPISMGGSILIVATPKRVT